VCGRTCCIESRRKSSSSVPPERLASQSFEEHLGRAEMLRRLGRPREALASYDAALASKPEAVAIHTTRGALFMSLGEWSSAAEAYDRAVAAGLDVGEVHVSRAMALLRARRFEEALAAADPYLLAVAAWSPGQPLVSDRTALPPGAPRRMGERDCAGRGGCSPACRGRRRHASTRLATPTASAVAARSYEREMPRSSSAVRKNRSNSDTTLGSS
jgi:hypothetical protein